MNGLLLAACVLMVGGLVPSMLLLGRCAAHRLVGLELLGAMTVLVLSLLSVVFRSAGVPDRPLVFTRLLGRCP